VTLLTIGYFADEGVGVYEEEFQDDLYDKGESNSRGNYLPTFLHVYVIHSNLNILYRCEMLCY
jgi:hypothetical protein